MEKSKNLRPTFGAEWQNDFGDLPDLQQTFYRNYDAALGRFISIDPKAEATDGLTPYQYANNNPAMMNDPMGDLPAFLTSRYDPNSGAAWQVQSQKDFFKWVDGNLAEKRLSENGFQTDNPLMIQAIYNSLMGYSTDYYDIDMATGFWAKTSNTSEYSNHGDMRGEFSIVGWGYAKFAAATTPKQADANQGGNSSWLSKAWDWMGEHFYTEVSGRLTQGAIGVMSGRFAGSEIDLGKHNLATITTGTTKGGINAYLDDGTKIYGGQLVVPVFDVPVGIGATHDAKSGENSGILGIGVFGYERNGNSNFIGIDMTSGVNFYFLGIESTAKIGFKW